MPENYWVFSGGRVLVSPLEKCVSHLEAFWDF